jgi:hypothetical protein
VKGIKGIVQDEFGVVLYNAYSVGHVEVKYNVHPAGLTQLISRKLPYFNALFPAYENADFDLGIASMRIPLIVIETAEGDEIAVLRQVGFVLLMSENLN